MPFERYSTAWLMEGGFRGRPAEAARIFRKHCSFANHFADSRESEDHEQALRLTATISPLELR